MAGYYASSVAKFINSDPTKVTGRLAECLIESFSGDHERQLNSRRRQVRDLQAALQKVQAHHAPANDWGIIFEYPLFRLQKRLDVVVLAGDVVAVIEFKVGPGGYASADFHQVEDYALGLRDFHDPSHSLSIWPVLCATEAPDGQLTAIVDGVGEVATTNADGLVAMFEVLASRQQAKSSTQIDLDVWDKGAYRPVPTIIQAAEALYAGHSVSDIAQATSDVQNLGDTTDALISIIEQARDNQEHIVVYVTGVPGSGKTLVGLNAIHDVRFSDGGRSPGAYLSGNTPLVRVLREALAEDDHKRNKRTKAEARRLVNSEIQTLMDFLREYLKAGDDAAPVDHVIVFDEAQRAWDAAYGAQKFDREKSEASLFLEIMGRHKDWAVIIALVGGGQEINRGELGLSEWGRSMAEENTNSVTPSWKAIASPEVLTGSEATAWQRLFEDGKPEWAQANNSLHLTTSIRSYGCEEVTAWVNAVLSSQIDRARDIAASVDEFPIFLTRDLEVAREWLTEQARGFRRCGLVASSGARRLRAEGLGVSLGADDLNGVAHWFLRSPGDIRSSFALEVSANEYACQGLELDYVGLCWGGDMIWDEVSDRWQPRKLGGAKWQTLNKPDGQTWALNKYRVLLTRARLGMIIWVPPGSDADETRSPEAYDQVWERLITAGARRV